MAGNEPRYAETVTVAETIHMIDCPGGSCAAHIVLIEEGEIFAVAPCSAETLRYLRDEAERRLGERRN